MNEEALAVPEPLPDPAARPGSPLAGMRLTEPVGEVQYRLATVAHSQARVQGLLVRDDLPADSAPSAPALPLSRLTGRTVAPTGSASTVFRRLLASGQRRLAVVDSDGRLLGMVCLKRRRTGFCSDAGVAARAAARQGRVDRRHRARRRDPQAGQPDPEYRVNGAGTGKGPGQRTDHGLSSWGE